ncbi:MAG: DUF58 domain-containing protein [Candidatus Thiodiazotropha sp.]|nr:DUF58 domain-containing protein [Candidatus Thiodiazotropha sp.]MCM8882552.1 DUF58 domain-containing protein [Candidatus Thiodiazotropha sp.]MCM8918740.1 DUF58 domain-containing protein [Candidatus Thiodiazotropha sp.]
MIPSSRLITALFLLSTPALLAIWYPAWAIPWKLLSALLLVFALLDLWRLRQLPIPELVRHIRTSIPVGVWTDVELRLRNRSEYVLNLAVHDHHPSDFNVQDQLQSIAIPPQRQTNLRYRVLPNRRGERQFDGVDLLVHSPLGLWRQKYFIDHITQVRVFPNFREIARYALLATDNHLSQMGVRRRQRRGEGSDFHQLREYRTGDAMRQIDWKASSRYRRLISKEYQDERDQQIVFMLDCGRHMRHEDGDGAHLDHALNAMLLLSYVADRQGDAVGFLSFAGEERWQPPLKGGDVVRRLLDRTYDLDSTLHAADYLAAAHKLILLQQRRALIIILTNSRNEERDDLLKAISLLVRRHLVVIADLHEASLDAVIEHPVVDLQGALRFQAVLGYLGQRKQAHERFTHRGALIIDSRPQQLPVNLVNAYLDVKASGKL